MKMGNDVMNILFVSDLSGDLSVGPSYSVPAQIKAQAKVDNVFWLNITDNFRDEWKEIGVPYLYGSKYKEIRLTEIMDKYICPDIVIMEGCYNYLFFKLIKDIKKNNIPYILVPRSQLTFGAQNNKALKKRIGNMIYFNRFIKGAAAVQYLTDQEAEDSSAWGLKGVIIPNGITQRTLKPKSKFRKSKINIVYIGRIDIYQKGLDLLIEACAKIKEFLIEKQVEISLYGKPTEGDLEKIQDKIQEYHLENQLIVCAAVFGEDKYSVLENTDIFIMTSRFEGLPMGLIEALSFGCPSIVTPGTNLAKEVMESNAGWVSESDADSIANTIQIAVEEVFSCGSKKSEGAYNLAKNYMWDDIAVMTHNICETIVKANGDMKRG